MRELRFWQEMSVWTGVTPRSPSWVPLSLQLRAGLTSGVGTRADTSLARAACREGGKEATRTGVEAGADTAGAAGAAGAWEPAGLLSRWELILSVTFTR